MDVELLNKEILHHHQQKQLNNNSLGRNSTMSNASSVGCKKSVEWLDMRRTDSGYDRSPFSPLVNNNNNNSNSYDRSSTAHSTLDRKIPNLGIKPAADDAASEVLYVQNPRATPNERTVYFEKKTKIVNENELRQLGFDELADAAHHHHQQQQQQQQYEDNCDEDVEIGELSNEARELAQLYRSISADPYGRRIGYDYADDPCSISSMDFNDSKKRVIIFGSVEELDVDDARQEFYPFRDAHQGKPLPGDNEYGTWGSRYDQKERQWKLSNGQWVRVGAPKKKPRPPSPEPEPERYVEELVREKPKPQRKPIVELVQIPPPQTGTDSEDDDDEHVESVDLEPLDVDLEPIVETRREPPRLFKPAKDESWIKPPSPDPSDVEVDVVLPLPPPKLEPPRDVDADLDALLDKYKPKPDDKKPVAAEPPAEVVRQPPPKKDTNTTRSPPQTEAKPLPPPPLKEVKLEPARPIYVEMKTPIKHDDEQEKRMEDPNLMWMRMGPAQYGPPFGTMGKRKGREEEWIGPPCELCHKQIEERRCMLAENRKFHCWHFSCVFCLKTLKPADFLIAAADNKPYCLNCHKREFPEISLAHLSLPTEN